MGGKFTPTIGKSVVHCIDNRLLNFCADVASGAGSQGGNVVILGDAAALAQMHANNFAALGEIGQVEKEDFIKETFPEFPKYFKSSCLVKSA